MAALAAHGRRLEEVGLVLVTHQHQDHCGLVATVRERAQCEVAALAPLAALLADHDREVEADAAYRGRLMRRHGAPPPLVRALAEPSVGERRLGRRVRVDRPLADGEELRLAGRRLVAHHRPGHSPTDTLFVDPEARVALAGDHLIGHVSSNPVLHRQWGEDPRGSALIAYLSSLDATAAMDLALVLPGHGEPVADHRGLIAQRRDHHRARREHVADLLAPRPLTAHEVALAIWGARSPAESFLAVSEVLGHADLLAADGRLAERDEDGVTVLVLDQEASRSPT